MEVKELGHLVLYVRDLEMSAAFYRDVLGFRPITPTVEGMRAAAFSSGRTHHELLLIEVGADASPVPRGRHWACTTSGSKSGTATTSCERPRSGWRQLGCRWSAPRTTP